MRGSEMVESEMREHIVYHLVDSLPDSLKNPPRF